MKKLTNEWLEYAANDLTAARTLHQSSNPPYEIITYHCQQSVEKNLKAILIEQNFTVPRTHDLKIIIQEVLKIADDFADMLSDCNRLTPFGVITRYPGSSMTVTKDHVDFALTAAERIEKRIVSYLEKT